MSITKNFISDFPKIEIFIVINTNEDYAIFRQQISCAYKSRINHRAPLGMKPSIRPVIDLHPVPVLVHHAAVFFVFRERLLKIIIVDEIVPRIIRRIDINHLDLPKITLLQQLQRLKIIPLNIQILRRVPVLAFLYARPQRLANGTIRFDNGCFLPDPRELVGLLAFAHVFCEHLLELLEINRPLKSPPAGLLSFCDTIWEQRRQLLEILLCEIRRFHLHLIHAKVPPSLAPNVSSLDAMQFCG